MSRTIQNTGTGQTEDISGYWLRHCAGRPRDAVFIGAEISRIDPSERTPTAIRNAVNNCAASLVDQLFNAASPHVPLLKPEYLHKVINKNYLSMQELSLASQEYDRLRVVSDELTQSSDSHVFCTLYALGLLGVVADDVGEPGRRVQRFLPSGRAVLGINSILPVAHTYVVHPALSDYLARRDLTYLSRISKYNIVGDGLEWHEPSDYVFVAIGDINRFRTSIMNKSGPAQAFREFWEQTFISITSRLAYKNITAGDSFVLADPSPTRLINACKGLCVTLKESSFGLDTRIGGHAGFWRLHNPLLVGEPSLSDVVGTAARVEPRAAPGTMLVTEDFFSGVKKKKNDEVIKMMKPFIAPDGVGESVEGEVNIAKSHEPPEYMRLWNISLLS